MKKLLFFILVLLPMVLSAESYVVINAANVRSGAGTQHHVIGKLSEGDTVEIVKISGKWGLLDFGDKDGYVALELLKPLPAVKFQTEFTVAGAGEWVAANPKTTVIVSLIVIVVAAILFLQFVKKMGRAYYTVGIVSVLLICGLEWLYFFHLGADSWFCEPKYMGLWIAGLNTVLFALFLAAQLFLFFSVFSDLVALQDCEPNYVVGIAAFPVAFLAFLGLLFTDNKMDAILLYICLGVAVAQGIQALILLVQLRRTFGLAIVVSIGYCLCMGTFLVLLAKMAGVILVAGILVILVCGIFFSGRSGRSNRILGRFKDKDGKKWEVTER